MNKKANFLLIVAWALGTMIILVAMAYLNDITAQSFHSHEVATYDQIHEKIWPQLENFNTQLKFTDTYYRLYSIDEIKGYFNQIELKKYEEDVYDCDDFALDTMTQYKTEFSGMAIGYMSIQGTIDGRKFSSSAQTEVEKVVFEQQLKNSNFQSLEVSLRKSGWDYFYRAEISHAVNVIVDSDLQIWYLDPQVGEFIKFEDRPIEEVKFIFM